MKRVLFIFIACLLAASAALADQRAEMLISVAAGELGYTATKGGYTKYGDWERPTANTAQNSSPGV